VGILTSYTTGQDYQGQVAGAGWKGQTFIVPHCCVNKVRLYLKRTTGSGVGQTLTVAIRAVDDAGLPTGGALVSATVAGNTIATSYDWVEVSFSSPVALLNRQYGLVASYYPTIAGQTIDWGSDDSSPTYADGQAVVSSNNGSTWSTFFSDDFLFEVHGRVRAGGGRSSALARGASSAARTASGPRQPSVCSSP